MRKFLFVLILFCPILAFGQPATNNQGEQLNICRIWDGTDVALVDGSGNQMVAGTLTCNAGSGTFAISAAALPLPAGASTSALQDGIIKDGTGDTTQANVVTGRLIVDGSGVTQPISGAVSGSGNFSIIGTKSNNGGVPGSTNLGTLPAVANASQPTQTETNQVALRVQLDGDLVVVMEDELPAGTQNIGDIDVLSIIPGTAATNLGKAEDAGHTTGDTGVAMWAVQQQADGTPTEFSATDLDYSPISVDSFGTMSGTLYMPWQWSYHENSSSALTDTTVHASCGAGLFNYIDTFVVSTGAATALNVFIEDSTTTTILGPYYLEAVAGRGFSVNYLPGKKQTNSATLISITTSAAIAHSIDITGHCGR